MCQVVGNFFGGTTSVGIGLYDNLDTDNGDNGVYVIEDWKIVDRLFFKNGKEQNEYQLSEMLEEIDHNMPEHQRLARKGETQ